MIRIVIPSIDDTLQIQEEERAPYFSRGAEDLFRCSEIISVSTQSIDSLKALDPRFAFVITRKTRFPSAMVSSLKNSYFLIEAPIHPETSALFGLEYVEKKLHELTITQPSGRSWYVRRRHIYEKNTDEDKPIPERYAHLPSQDIRIQKYLSPCDKVLLHATDTNSNRWPFLFIKDNVMVITAPLFDIAVQLLSYPPLKNKLIKIDTLEDIKSLLFTIIRLACENFTRIPYWRLIRISKWPKQYSSAFVIRHDFDRKVPKASLTELIRFYRKHNFKSSIGFLSKFTSKNNLKLFTRNGHELQLHTDEHDFNSFSEHLACIRKGSGTEVKGVTFHGGSMGFRGDVQFDWIERAGLEYSENFSITGLPAPLYRPDSNNIISRTPVMLTPLHFSLDVGTKSQEHQMNTLFRDISKTLQSEEMIVLMNHPDIHRNELYSLLEKISDRNMWKTTLLTIVRWLKNTLYGAQVINGTNGQVQVVFPEPLPYSIKLYLAGWPDGRSKIIELSSGLKSLHIEGLNDKTMGLEAIITRTYKKRSRIFSMLRCLPAAIRGRHIYVTSKKNPINKVLVSRTDSTEKIDAAHIKGNFGNPNDYFKLIIQDGKKKVPSGDESKAGFIHTLGSQILKYRTSLALIGKSIVTDLHPTVAAALGILAREMMANPVLTACPSFGFNLSGMAALHLARWLEKESINSFKTLNNSLSFQELSYFLGSGGYRSLALRQSLLHAAPNTRFRRIADIGGGVGFSSWMLATESIYNIDQVVIVEPENRFCSAGARLWSGTNGIIPDLNFKFIPLPAEKYADSKGFDLIMILQAVHKFSREKRESLFQNFAEMLRPGGLLVVNEIVRSDENNSKDHDEQYPSCLNKGELTSLMTRVASPKVFHRSSRWQKSETIDKYTAEQLSSHSFFVSVKTA